MKSTSPDITYTVTVSATGGNDTSALIYETRRAGVCGPRNRIDFDTKEIDLDAVERWLGREGFKRTSGWTFLNCGNGPWVTAPVAPFEKRDDARNLALAGGGVEVTVDGIRLSTGETVTNELVIPGPFADDLNRFLVALDWARIFGAESESARASARGEIEVAVRHAEGLVETCRHYLNVIDELEATNAA
jgi:hypothetical protein